MPKNAPDEAAVQEPSFRVPVIEKPAPFWYGVLSSAPFEKCIVGAITFEKETFEIIRDAKGNPVADDQTGLTKRRHRSGTVTTFTPAQLNRLREKIETRVVRVWYSEPAKEGDPERIRVQFSSTNGLGYNPLHNEEPLAKYLYMVPAEERGLYMDNEPPPILSK